MTSQIKAIIFDFGNVLLEWDPRYVYERYFPNDPEGYKGFIFTRSHVVHATSTDPANLDENSIVATYDVASPSL